ncbi:MAG: LysM peptidoglycan-binding domain-containing protein [Clostridia bacterium]|nr:LysM peptidoglycan-binding domain-containing protein [Clostridia bacterium]
MVIHVVLPGQTPAQIAAIYGVNPTRMMRDNGYTLDTPLVAGQSLVVLLPDVTHIVAPGESVSSIAELYGITVNELYRNNYELGGRPSLYPGQLLVISYQGEKLGAIYVNAYSYPFISDWLLRATLPYLSYLIPFTYGISERSGLVNLGDIPLIETANEYGVASIMHLSTLTEQDIFSTERATTLFRSQMAINTLSQAILRNIKTKGYQGLDIDFEYLGGIEAENYVNFVATVTNTLNSDGYPVWVALAPKTSDTQPGLLYEGHDYAGLAEAANYVFLMTYEWGYKYSSPQAVAPIDAVRRVLDYAVSRISPDKIFFGIPTYGYDWPLPFIKGETAATSISSERAIELAREYGAEIKYDTVAQSPWFNYVDGSGVAHEVWFEDARSINAKLMLASEYKFRGVGYWDLLRPFPQNWIVLNSLYNIASV